MAINPTNSYFEQQWNLKIIKAPEAYLLLRTYSAADGALLGAPADRTFGSAELIIGIVDLGIETSGGLPINPAFQLNVSNSSPRLVATYDFVKQGPDPLDITKQKYIFPNNDEIGGAHGIECASTSLAGVKYLSGYNGTSAVVGVAGNCRLIGLRVNSSNHDLAMWWGANMTDLGSQIELFNEKIPAGAVYRLPVGVQMDILSRSWTMTDYHEVAFDLASFGRNGRGILLFNSSGNEKSEISDDNFERRWNIVGATKIDDGAFDFNTEARATYSNYGKRLDVCAPSGGSPNFDPGSSKNRTMVATIHDSGTFDDLYSTDDWNVTLTKVTNTEYTVMPSDLLGICSGQFIEIELPNSPYYQIREIKAVTVGLGTLTITLDSRLNSFGNSFNINTVIARVAYAHANTTAALVATNTIVPLDSTKGFRINQKVFLDNGLNKELVTVTAVGPGNNITIAATPGPGLQYAYPINTKVTKGFFEANITSFNRLAGRISVWNVDNARGFYLGQLVRLKSGTEEYELSVESVDVGSQQIGLSIKGASAITTGKIQAIGGGEYNTTFNGTSAACPVAAGVGALLLSANLKPLNWLEAKHILRESAFKIDLLCSDPNGIWKDETGAAVIKGSNKLAGTPTITSLSAASVGNVNQLTLASVAGAEKDRVIKISSGSHKQFAAITYVDTGTNTITLDRKIIFAYPNGSEVAIGLKAHHSKWYGKGRVDAERAVEMARNWDVNASDLWIRDFPADTGVAHVTPALIDSPDVWIRNTDPAVDTVNYMTPELPNPFSDSWIYVCVRNKGLQASLPGYEVVLTLTDTLDPASPMVFAFPDRWMDAFKPSYVGFEEVTSMLTPIGDDVKAYAHDGKYLEKPEGKGNPEYKYDAPNFIFHDNPSLPAMADKKKPHILPSIPAGGSYIAIFPWPKKIKVARPIGRSFLKVHITPFDAEDAVAGLSVESNNNLTFKRLIFTKIELNDGSTLDPLKSVDVDTLGTTVLQPINILVQNILPAYVNNTSIKMTMQFTDGSADQVCEFKHNGTGWAPVAPFPAWATMSAPLPGGLNVPYQEFTNFNGNLILTNLHGKVTFEIKVTDGTNTVLERTIEIPINAVAPTLPDGAAGSDTFKFHTFTDLDRLPLQVLANKYGPISSTNYRTAAMFTGIVGAAPLKAYAVTRGRVIVQEVTGSPGLINLILQPDDQPNTPYGRVKYFVYRGVKATSYLVGPGGAVKPDNPVVNNDFLDRHWALRAILDAKELALNPGYTSPGVKRDDLGLVTSPATQPGNTPISELFNTNRFQIATRGWEIGEFETAGLYGFQVIVDGPYHEPTLDDVRNLDPQVTITYTGMQPQYSAGQREDIATLHKREQILSYLDPAALIGQLELKSILVKNSGSPTPVNPIDLADLYINVLVKFATRDTVYVDVRNELNQSLNFFGNYGVVAPPNLAQLMFLNSANVYVNKDYTASGWPILILNATDFATNTTAKVKLGLQFPLGDNADPMLYLPNGSFFDTYPYTALKFRELVASGTHTAAVEFGLRNYPGGPAIMPAAIKIVYCKRYDLGNLPPAVFPATKIIRDDIWDTILAPGDIHLVPRTNHVVWDSRSELRYSGWTSKNDFDFALQTGRAIDSIGEVAYAYVLGPAEFQASTSEKITHVNVDLINGSVQARSFLEHLTKKKLVTVAYEEIDENPSNFPCLRVQSKDGNHSNRKVKPSANDIVLYAYTATEKATIDAAISTANFLPGSSRYYMAQAHKLKKNLFSHPYFEMELAVQGIVYNAGSFTYQVVLVPTGVKLYSVDGRSYFSIAYSNAVKAQMASSPY